MQTKIGVGWIDIHPAARYALLVFEEEARRVTGCGIVVTGMQDGIHSRQSLHYGIAYEGRKRTEADDRARAFDVRTRDYTEQEVADIQEGVERRLGPDFDVVLEATHWHCEYDPKPGPTPRLVA